MFENVMSSQQVQQFHQLLEGAQDVVVTCHVSPDGDAMGSVLALVSWLRRKGKTATAVIPNRFPDFLGWLPGADESVWTSDDPDRAQALMGDADLVFCLDYNAPSRTGELQPLLEACHAPKVMIDHHPSPSDFCELTVSHPEYSSTCELLYGVLHQLGETSALTLAEATAVYTGMMTDTGGFTYNSNRAGIFTIIGELIGCGIDKDKIYRNVFNNYSEGRFRLMGYVLYEKMIYLPEYHAAILPMTSDELKRFDYIKGDTEGLVNMPLQIKGTRLSISLRESTDEPGIIRVSLRSVDDFPCNRMSADFFNGGGHLNASGGRLEGTVEQAVATARRAIEAYKHLLQDE